ncbi:hypothetical protein [uncultured Gammaproteobacteria bacterium]|nr:hypothetical protein [uncultured Gammaproteobacteria bacterium]CAC9556354.1 hypothetical protein [uncultured Gammaproteobacteria bacterium]CAC9569036.1 hypothetical protein [uncultured Gammaproteobacteria bacterium]CAC9956717.1 hypothetical protein [uncultured Gammaproteobacteria bacterium]
MDFYFISLTTLVLKIITSIHKQELKIKQKNSVFMPFWTLIFTP